MKVAVYSGSFNPLHIGHQAIMEHLTREKEFDWVYLVISPQNPFKDASIALSGLSRYEAAVQAVGRHPGLRVRVDDIEFSMPQPNYTIHTLDTLKQREPDNEFTLVIGADNLDSIRGWKNYQRLLIRYGVVVFPRKGYDLDVISSSLRAEPLGSLYKIQITDAPLVDISSTDIREAVARGEDMSSFLM